MLTHTQPWHEGSVTRNLSGDTPRERRTQGMNIPNNTVRGVAFLVLSLLVFSLQDIAIKWLGGDYPVSEIVLFRSIVALPAALLFVRAEGQRGLPTTQRQTWEYARGLCLFLSFTTYMLGLAALPLADVAAIRYSGPLMITALSVLFLGERVEPRHWLALLVGFVGVLLIARVGSASFNLGSVFVLVSVLFYALSVLITRGLRTTDSSATIAYYSSLVYVVATTIMAPLTLAVGEVQVHPSVAFLFRAWSMPTFADWMIMSGLGLVWASGMYLMARAYSLAQASVVAPFEYATLPINAGWGFLLWRKVPPTTTWIGALLTVLSGVYIVYREQREQTAASQGRASAAVNVHEEPARKEATMNITRNGSQPSGKGPAEWFTGAVRIDPLFEATEPARVRGASVTFEPGARTAWHTHPLGQTLIVTAGCGWAQREGGPVEEIRPGDVVWFPPGEKHWHGATATTAMTHIAIQEALDGKAVTWMEHVSDDQYGR